MQAVVSLQSTISEKKMLTIVRSEMKMSHPEYPSSNLIDGKLGSFGASNKEEDGMWVRVYLEENLTVTKIIVHNRKDCCKDRIVGASVFIKSGDETVTDCGVFEDVRDFYTFDCIGEGNVVELSQEGNVGQWNIAEIMVYEGEFDLNNIYLEIESYILKKPPAKTRLWFVNKNKWYSSLLS